VTSKFILLVEDNADDELLTLRALKRGQINNQTVVVRDGEEALEFLFCTNRYSSRDIAHQPEIILLDLKLPKVDGHQVLAQIRANEATKLLPVIILSSSRQEGDLHKSYSDGANSYVVKPVDSGEFIDAIQHIGKYWLGINETC